MTVILATWDKPGKVAIEAAGQARQDGADLRTTLEKGLAAAELDPELVAIGRGSLPNSEGEIELDASMMDGADLSAGAVCGVRGICPIISVARQVMEETPHVMLAGDQARQFAISKGHRPWNLMTVDSIKWYDEWRQRQNKDEVEYVHSMDEHIPHSLEDRVAAAGHHGDTVTMLGWESPDHCVAASSTSGLAWKMPGRIGDSPIIGAGIYADDEVGAAGATGWGEELWRAVASFRTTEAMRMGMSPKEACEYTIDTMMRKQPSSRETMSVVFALSNKGEFGAAATQDGFHLWIWRDGEITCEEVPGRPQM